MMDMIGCQCALCQAERLSADIHAKAALFDEMRRALSDYVICQGRMLSQWSEGDKATKTELWGDLHNCERFGRDVLDRANKIVKGELE